MLSYTNMTAKVDFYAPYASSEKLSFEGVTRCAFFMHQPDLIEWFSIDYYFIITNKQINKQTNLLVVESGAGLSLFIVVVAPKS